MNEFLYPRDLYRSLTKFWSSSPLTEGWPRVELPDEKTLNELLDVCYHASFLVEEGRRITFRAVFFEETTALKPPQTDTNHPTALYCFDAPLPFTPKELCRLAPTADPTRVLIAVKRTDGDDGALVILGLVDIGSSLWAHSQYQRTSGHGLPDALIIGVSQPGQLTITRRDKALIRLLNGELAVPTENLFLRGPIGEFFFEAADWFIGEGCKLALRYKVEDQGSEEEEAEGQEELQDEGEDEDAQNDDLTFAHQTFLELLLLSARDLGHGGTILFVSDEVSYTDQSLVKHVNFKHLMPSSRPQEVLLHKMAVRLLWQEDYGAVCEKGTISNSAFQSFDALEFAQKDAVDSVVDLAKFIAGLTAVDGAVILTDKLRLLGFGAEVLASSRMLESVHSSESEFADTLTEVPISAYGTRHRSAFRFCSSIKPSVGFIFSQDGGVKAVRQVDQNLVMWPYFEIGYRAGF